MELGGEMSRGGCKSLEGVSAWEYNGRVPRQSKLDKK